MSLQIQSYQIQSYPASMPEPQDSYFFNELGKFLSNVRGETEPTTMDEILEIFPQLKDIPAGEPIPIPNDIFNVDFVFDQNTNQLTTCKKTIALSISYLMEIQQNETDDEDYDDMPDLETGSSSEDETDEDMLELETDSSSEDEEDEEEQTNENVYPPNPPQLVHMNADML